MQTVALSTTWSAEQRLNLAPAGAGNFHTAINDTGTAVVLWDQSIATNINQVQAAVRSAGSWSAVIPISDPAVTAQSGAAVVDESGRVTILYRVGSALYERSWNAGIWSIPTLIPNSPGYDLLIGLGATTAGSLQVVTAAVRTPGSIGRPGTFDLQALTKTGAWSSPIQLTATPAAVVAGGIGFHMNRAGQGLVHAGFNVFRSPTLGAWGPVESVPAGAGQVYTTASALDEGGRGYFVFMKRYGGTLLSTAAMGTPFGTPKVITKFAPLGSSVAVVASSADHALVYGVDYTTYKVRAAASADGGKTWGGLLSLGGGASFTDLLSAAGSTTGLYALAFNNDGDTFWVATGSGLGTGAAAWSKQRLAQNYALGTASLSGTHGIAGWARGADPVLSSYIVGAASSVITP